MEVLPRVDPAEDPWFAVRTALGITLTVLLTQWLQVAMPLMPAALGLALLSGQRGAFVLRRGLLGPVVLMVLGVLLTVIARLSIDKPLLYIGIFAAISMIGLAMMILRGSNEGMILAVIPHLISVSALTSDQTLIVMRDALIVGGGVLAVVIPAVNWLLPARTSRIHVPQSAPHGLRHPVLHLLAATVILQLAAVYAFVAGDATIVILPIVVAIIIGHARPDLRRQEAAARLSATVLGGGVALAMLLVYGALPHIPVFLLLVALIVLVFSQRMVAGRLLPVTYQFTCSVALVIALGALSSGDPVATTLQRVIVTVGGGLLAIGLLALTERLLQRF